MLVVGVDPGKHGGITALDAKSGDIVFSEIFPLMAGQLDPKLMYELLCHLLTPRLEEQKLMVFCEKVGARPGQAAKAMFTFGTGFGYLHMAFVALGLSYELVAPHLWSKVMHAGVDTRIKDTKKRSWIAASRLWPSEDFKVHSKPHDGLFEAALIAEYGRRKSAGGN